MSKVGGLGIGIVLARVLGPEAFGTYAVAFVALAAVLSFNDIGVSLAIVRWPGDPRAIASTVTTISVIGSTLVFVGGYLAAAPFAEAMGDPTATPVVRLLLVSVLIDGFVATPAALLQREFKQGTRMIVDQSNVWVGAIVSVALALTGFGAMSLAIGRLAGTVVSAVLLFAFSPLPFRFGWDREHVRPLLVFGLPLAGSSIIVFAVGYADQLVVGNILGATMLSFYVLAFNLSSWPVSVFSQPLRSVAPAAFSRLQHDPEQMRTTFLALMRVLAAVAIPVCFFISGAAHPIVEFVYGEQWIPAESALTWLAALAAFRIVFELSYDYLVVKKRSGSLLVVQVIWLIALVPALLVGALFHGIAGVGMAQVAVSLVVVTPIYLWRLARAGVSARSVGSRVWLPLVAGFVVWGESWLLAQTIPNPFLAAFLAGIIALAIIGLLVLRERATIALFRTLGTSAVPVDDAIGPETAFDRGMTI
ncbi:oligosaccharide flippase family protein [Lacisediminihabitans sp. G11-30]|uniref:Oligosaccharide flippase family protein n=1 Tax=Lacisediminihabitans changchengi TaxID=2787634 RepID=A0A934ST82_9MICO|nr:oligosaccharide flippase family protein [Lacisediminihabitans changchengi]